MSPRTIPVTVTVETTRHIPEDVDQAIATARALQAEGQAKIEQAAGMIRGAARDLIRQGWAQTDIAAVLGVSRGRVGQLVGPKA